MRGTIKFVDGKTGQWGFVTPDSGEQDAYFSINDFLSESPWVNDKGTVVEFEVDDTQLKPRAHNLKLVAPTGSVETPENRGGPGQAFSNWGAAPFTPFVHRDGRKYSSIFELLSQVALKENWYFGVAEDKRYPILRNYFIYTFFRLYSEEKIVSLKDVAELWATFNTGLVDALYDPIYALFKRNYQQQPPWRFFDFCIPGKGSSGRRLTSVFDPLPGPAKYFDNNFDMILEADRDIHVDYEHVIFDGIAGDRFPAEFLRANLPRNFQWEEYTQKSESERADFLKLLSKAVEADVRCTRAIKNRLEDAKLLAEKRTRWNFKTAIPQYYPQFNVMSLLLPLALVDDEVVDIALVVTKNPSGSYQGRTVFPLHWAYQNARLVCRPDSDWLIPDRIQVASDARDAEG